MTNRLDISAELRALTDKLGYEYNNVAQIIFKPGEVTADVFKVNENGAKYIEGDKAARETLVTKVRT